MTYPSLMAHVVSGMLVVFSIIFVVVHWSKLGKLDTYRTLMLLLFFATVVGIHGISHLLLEKEYNYMPIYWLKNL